MKLALITDQHIGARNDSLIFDKYFEKFYSEIFFPTLEKEGINTVIDLGDLFERRRFVNFEILSNFYRYFLDEIRKRNIFFHSIVGNHNIYHSDTNELNNLDLLIGSVAKNIFVEPTEMIFSKHKGSLKILMLPWITKENEKRVLEILSTTDATVVFGHLNLKGFQMDKGNVTKDGMEKSLFGRFDMVLSGHFHHKNSDGKITYLGVPYEQTWADCDDPKGFHILETNDLSMKFIQNPFTIHKKLVYNDSGDVSVYEQIIKDKGIDFKDKYVKIVVENKKNHVLFEEVFNIIFSSGCYEVIVVDTVQGFVINENLKLEGTEQNNLEDFIAEEDTGNIITSYVDKANYADGIDKNFIKKEITNLYTEAMNV